LPKGDHGLAVSSQSPAGHMSEPGDTGGGASPFPKGAPLRYLRIPGSYNHITVRKKNPGFGETSGEPDSTGKLVFATERGEKNRQPFYGRGAGFPESTVGFWFLTAGPRAKLARDALWEHAGRGTLDSNARLRGLMVNVGVREKTPVRGENRSKNLEAVYRRWNPRTNTGEQRICAGVREELEKRMSEDVQHQILSDSASSACGVSVSLEGRGGRIFGRLPEITAKFFP